MKEKEEIKNRERKNEGEREGVRDRNKKRENGGIYDKQCFFLFSCVLTNINRLNLAEPV